MSSQVLNGHQFNLQTKLFQDQAINAAIKKAEQIAAQKDTHVRVHIASLAICKEAYNTFKKKVQETFFSPTYHDLVILTLQAREKLFFYDLKERVKTILSNPNSEPIS